MVGKDKTVEPPPADLKIALFEKEAMKLQIYKELMGRILKTMGDSEKQ